MEQRKEVSISAARENLPSLVRDAERGLIVTLTRRGEPVAVLIATDRYDAQMKRSVPLSRAIDDFRRNVDLEELDIEAAYDGVRDRSRGRDVRL